MKSFLCQRCRWLLLISILCAGTLHASQIYVRLSDPVYPYLDRLATQGVIREFLNDTKPLQRDEIAKYLAKLAKQKDQLSETDRRLLDEFIADYRLELSDKKYFKLQNNRDTYFLFHSWNNLSDGVKHFYQYHKNQEKLHFFVRETDNEMIWVDWDEMARFETKNDLTRLIWQDGFRIASQIGEHFSFYVDGYRFLQQARNGFNKLAKEFKGGFHATNNEKGVKFYSFDYSHAYMQYHGLAGTFQIGNQPLYWGNGPNSIILSDNTESFAYLSWQRHFKHSKYTFFHGSLMPASPEYSVYTPTVQSAPEYYAQKYLVGQRFELAPHSRFHITLTEMAVYGRRNPDLVYLIPVVFLWPTQHNLMDRDNILMAGEFEYFPFQRFKIYGTFLLDELKPSKLGTDWWGNKHGVQLGFQFTPQMDRFPTDLTVEFTAVRPWTYTHKYSIDTYTNSGVGLGFYGGPNSQLWYARNRWWFGRRNRLSISYRQLKHGVEPLNPGVAGYYPIGSDPNENYQNRNPVLDNNTKPLIGNIITYQDFSIRWNYQWSDLLSFELGYTLSDINHTAENYTSVQVRFDY